MSAYYSVCYADGIEMVTDGAVYTPEGVVEAFAEKVFRSDVIPLAVTGRGFHESVRDFALAIVEKAECGSFDRTIKDFGLMMDELRSSGILEGLRNDGIELLIAGISEEHGPIHVYFSTFAYMEGIETWKVYIMGKDFAGGPLVTHDEIAACGGDLSDPEFSLAKIGVPVMEAMRRKGGLVLTRPELGIQFQVGGHVDYTRITADGVTTERLHTWPDVIGEKIDPFAHDGLADPKRLSA